MVTGPGVRLLQSPQWGRPLEPCGEEHASSQGESSAREGLLQTVANPRNLKERV